MRRPLLPGDVSAAARALLAVPAGARNALCRRIFGGAAEALAYGKLHPRWGDGSLSAAARGYRLADEPFLDDPEYLACTRLVLRQAAAVLGEGQGGAPAR
ncbi:DUF7742 family protein [Leisingera sp. ANG-Vp]|uniref:DUF7742 family protein n=1 Tax=Leisingera sp. ANG-Vp TaxID=1577896 RepID=UPI000580A830|nr:hypothetical protein [Leisingera sp. ANG-Vp]KIC22639.1 hypothetical protein RA20_01875 [Leisingera sp. ANG-Vp]